MQPSWVKSSFSFSNGNCVEVAFQRSSRCQNGECAEVAHLRGGEVLVRDSKNPTGPVLAVGPGAWRAFTGRVKAGRVPR